jgi:hypothetical protein
MTMFAPPAMLDDDSNSKCDAPSFTTSLAVVIWADNLYSFSHAPFGPLHIMKTIQDALIRDWDLHLKPSSNEFMPCIAPVVPLTDHNERSLVNSMLALGHTLSSRAETNPRFLEHHGERMDNIVQKPTCVHPHDGLEGEGWANSKSSGDSDLLSQPAMGCWSSSQENTFSMVVRSSCILACRVSGRATTNRHITVILMFEKLDQGRGWKGGMTDGESGVLGGWLIFHVIMNYPLPTSCP